MAALVDWRQGEQAKIVIPPITEIKVYNIDKLHYEEKPYNINYKCKLYFNRNYFCALIPENNYEMEIEDNIEALNGREIIYQITNISVTMKSLPVVTIKKV